MSILVVYEAGKIAKGAHQAQVPVYPYYMPSGPTLVPFVPSSQAEPKLVSIPSMENNLAGGEHHQYTLS